MPLTAEERKQYRAQAEAAVKARNKKLKEERRRDELAIEERAEAAGAKTQELEKSKAMRIFLSEGGTRDAFEKVWPKMRADIIYAKTVQAMTTDRPRRRLRL